MPSPPYRVLFVCGDNASRSQMAEAWLRHLGGRRFVARSAGTEPMHLDPLATRVMQELDLDMSSQRGKNVAALLHERFDLVVTLCDDSLEACPTLAFGGERVHQAFDDPTWFENVDGDPLEEYRRLRDAVREYVEALVARVG